MERTKGKNLAGPKSQEASDTKKATNKFNLDDPGQVNRYLSRDFADFYANRTEMMIGQEDVRFDFIQILGVKDGKIQLKSQCSVTISFQHARRVRDLLNNYIKDDDPKFAPFVGNSGADEKQ
ncbi:DUF3467 domain-containing protein [bacterium]|nr:DUF3467 domain-containing protein [bacterium]